MDFTSITNSWGYILSGAAYTVQLTAITAVGGLFLGTLLALCHISEKRWLSAPAKLYINLMRAVPLVLVLFWYFLLMPEILRIILGLDHPVKIGAEMTAIITFVLFEAAYFAEIMRQKSAAVGEYLPIVEINSTQNKDARIQSLQPFIKNGYVKFSRKHKTLLKQMTEYPMGKNDDGPDGLQMAVKLALDVKVGRKVEYKSVIARALDFKRGAY